MNTVQKVLVTAGVLVLLVIVLYVISSTISNLTGYVISEGEDTSEFESCLQEQDIVLYINTEEPGQTLGSNPLIDYLDNIEIVNCIRNKDICDDAGVTYFPSWLINNQMVAGELSVDELSDLTGCTL